MEIREQLLHTLARKRDIQETKLRQSRSILNTQRKSHHIKHQGNLTTFASLKQSLLLERLESKLNPREQMQKLLTIKNKLSLQQRKIEASALTLEQLRQQGEQLNAQYLQLKDQRRIIQEHVETYSIRTLQHNQALVSEEQSVLSLLSADSENAPAPVIEATLSTSAQSVPCTTDESRFHSLAGAREVVDMQYLSFSERGTPRQSQNDHEQALHIDAHGRRREKESSAFEQELDPQLSFEVSDYRGNQVAVALTLRPERGIEVNVQRQQASALVQSQHEARRIERVLRQAGLEVAQITIGQMCLSKKGALSSVHDDNETARTAYLHKVRDNEQAQL